MGPNSSGSSWMMLRSIQNSERVAAHQLSRGTTKRILRFARPYRHDIIVFLITVVFAAGIGVATPVLAAGMAVSVVRGAGLALASASSCWSCGASVGSPTPLPPSRWPCCSCRRRW